MRLLVVLLLATAALAAVPAADAHQCQGSFDSCGACVKGEVHNHQDAKGQCSSGPGYLTEQGYGGQKADVPAPALALLLGGAGVAAVLLRRE